MNRVTVHFCSERMPLSGFVKRGTLEAMELGKLQSFKVYKSDMGTPGIDSPDYIVRWWSVDYIEV